MRKVGLSGSMKDSFASLLIKANFTDVLEPREMLAIVERITEDNHHEVVVISLAFLLQVVVQERYEEWVPIFTGQLIADKGFKSWDDMRGFISMQLLELKLGLLTQGSFDGNTWQKITFALVKGLQHVGVEPQER